MNLHRYAWNWWWIGLPVIFLGLIFWRAGTFVYIDGDDAASIAYHVMGRDPQVQPVYSPYHGMMDRLLSLLPASEPVLRHTAFRLTRLAGVCFAILLLLLTFDWLKQISIEHTAGHKALITLAFLLAVPELAYLSLTYSPTLIAMCLALAAHLLLRYCLRQTALPAARTSLLYALTLVLFGLGVSFRWNVAAYALVILADVLIWPTEKPLSKNWRHAVTWGSLASLSAVLMVTLSGYGLADFLAKVQTVQYVMNQAGSLGPQADVSLSEILLRSGLTLTPLFTPGLIGLALLGLTHLMRTRHPLLLPVMAGLLSALPWLKSGVPKFIITSLPPLVLLVGLGGWVLMQFAQRRNLNVILLMLSLVVLVSPWLVGVQLSRANAAWGPGFEMRRFDEPTAESGVRVVLGPGAAFPTPEGVRALYGHGWVLLGEWRNFTQKAATERQQVIETALRLKLPIVVTHWAPEYYLNALYARGFQTSDPYDRLGVDGLFTERRFQHANGETVVVYYAELEGEQTTFVSEALSRLAAPSMIVLTGYSRTLRELYQAHPNAVQSLGFNSALLQLEQLRAP
ncbi:MAG: hypothetical protein DDG60_16585 [Anaerolineae bacterium]|nr:MAG: hypothetical protein DDG60_16585 [Anaerolineae bacterium]